MIQTTSFRDSKNRSGRHNGTYSNGSSWSADAPDANGADYIDNSGDLTIVINPGNAAAQDGGVSVSEDSASFTNRGQYTQ